MKKLFAHRIDALCIGYGRDLLERTYIKLRYRDYRAAIISLRDRAVANFLLHNLLQWFVA